MAKKRRKTTKTGFLKKKLGELKKKNKGYFVLVIILIY